MLNYNDISRYSINSVEPNGNDLSDTDALAGTAMPSAFNSLDTLMNTDFLAGIVPKCPQCSIHTRILRQ